MKIKSDEITTVIRQEIEQYSGKLEISEVGQVVEVGDVALAIVFTKNALEEASSVAEGKKECSNAT